jgi:biopolymer transport protein ExbD
VRPEIRGPEINVTPLVDIVLVLLIIFMVIIPQLDAGAAITPPSARNPDAVDALAETATIMVTGDGELFLEKIPIAVGELEGALRSLRKSDPHRSVRIKGDRAAPYRMIRDVYRLCQIAGFPGAGLEVGERKDDELDRPESEAG